jgi:phosphate transport system protein
MRETYHGQLDAIVVSLVGLTETVADAVNRATRSLLDADLPLAEQVITDDRIVDAAHDDIEQRAFALLARQSPVAGELRTIVAALRMTNALGRMGDLAAHVAKVARLRYPDSAVPVALRDNFRAMATLAESMVRTAAQTLRDRNVENAAQLAEDDEEMDELRAAQFRVLLSEDWNEGVEKAVDAALLGRYYERIADHAVNIGSRVIYLTTGSAPEGDQWPKA